MKGQNELRIKKLESEMQEKKATLQKIIIAYYGEEEPPHAEDDVVVWFDAAFKGL